MIADCWTSSTTHRDIAGARPARAIRIDTDAEARTEAAPLTEEELAAIETLADAATGDPDEERECRRCGDTMSAPEPGDDPSPLCHSCAHYAAAELGADAGRLLATVRAQQKASGKMIAKLGAMSTEQNVELCAIRTIVGAREGETTVDAVERAVAISEAWRELAESHEALLSAHVELAVSIAADATIVRPKAKLRALGVDPYARS